MSSVNIFSLSMAYLLILLASFQRAEVFISSKSSLLIHFFIVVPVQLSPFSPQLGPWPTLKPTPFGFVHVSFMHVPWWTFPSFPPLSLSYVFLAASKQSLPHTKLSRFSPKLSSMSFRVPHFTFWSMIHFQLIFVRGIKSDLESLFFARECLVVSVPSVNHIYVSQFLSSLICSVEYSFANTTLCWLLKV